MCNIYIIENLSDIKKSTDDLDFFKILYHSDQTHFLMNNLLFLDNNLLKKNNSFLIRENSDNNLFKSFYREDVDFFTFDFQNKTSFKKCFNLFKIENYDFETKKSLNNDLTVLETDLISYSNQKDFEGDIIFFNKNYKSEEEKFLVNLNFCFYKIHGKNDLNDKNVSFLINHHEYILLSKILFINDNKMINNNFKVVENYSSFLDELIKILNDININYDLKKIYKFISNNIEYLNYGLFDKLGANYFSDLEDFCIKFHSFLEEEYNNLLLKENILNNLSEEIINAKLKKRKI